MTPRIGSLCSGYGGLDIAVTTVLGGEMAWHCQYDPDDRHQYAAKVLTHHWPTTPNHGDITRIDWTTVEPVDILTAGFPCQDISNAGKRTGIEGEKSGIWGNVADAISHLRPRIIFLENVAAITVRGLDRVAGDLASLGFDAEWTCLRASDVGAPHRRERWFCLAWTADSMRPGLERLRVCGTAPERREPAADAPCKSEREPADQTHTLAGVRPTRPEPGHRSVQSLADAPRDGRFEGRPEPTQVERRSDVAECRSAAAADPHRAGSRSELDREPHRPETDDEHDVTDASGRVLDWRRYGPAIARWEHVTGRPAPAPTEPGKNGPRLAAAFVEWLMGLSPGWVTDVPGISRTAQLKALGNGVVPQQGAAALRMLLTQVPANPWTEPESYAGAEQPSLFAGV